MTPGIPKGYRVGVLPDGRWWWMDSDRRGGFAESERDAVAATWEREEYWDRLTYSVPAHALPGTLGGPPSTTIPGPGPLVDFTDWDL